MNHKFINLISFCLNSAVKFLKKLNLRIRPEKRKTKTTIHIIQSLGFGGAESILLSFTSLTSTNEQVIFTFTHLSDPKYTSRANCQVYQIFSFSGIVAFLALIYTSLLGTKNTYVFWLYKPAIVFLPILSLFNSKKVCYIHSSPSSLYWTRKQLISPYLFRILSYIFKPKVIFCSFSSQKEHRLWHRDSQYVLLNSVEIKAYPFVERKLIINSNSPLRILSVTKDCPLKDPLNLFNSLDFLHKWGINFSLDLIGEGTDSDSLKSYVRKLPYSKSVCLHGPVSNTLAFYHASSLLVCSSCNESLPLCIIEAQLTGLPVISTDVGDIPWLIKNSDFLVPPKDPLRLANAIAFFRVIIEENYLSYSLKISNDMKKFDSSNFYVKLDSLISGDHS